MRIINIEDCLELMCGLLIEEEFTPAIDIAEKVLKSEFKDADKQKELVNNALKEAALS